MLPGELKPVLAALVLPPAGPLLLVLLGLLVATRRRAAGLVLALVGVVVAWLLGTTGMAVVLARLLLPPMEPLRAGQLRQVQAIVVLGGGVLPQAPEYGAAQPSPPTLGRLRYGAWLARSSGKPLAFAGGIGWAAAGTPTEAEGSVAVRVLQDDYGMKLRWMDDRSRDTVENAARMAEQLQRDGVRQIALVTDATHIPRATAAFRAAGFDVLPAPTNFVFAAERPLLQWLPSSSGTSDCRAVLREWLARAVLRAG
ncbi:MAG TPA: YdcF family protein [Ramlibacter sp.]